MTKLRNNDDDYHLSEEEMIAATGWHMEIEGDLTCDLEDTRCCYDWENNTVCEECIEDEETCFMCDGDGFCCKPNGDCC